MTVLDAKAHQMLGPDLYGQLNKLIDDWERVNEKQIDMGAVRVILKTLWPQGRQDDNAEAWDSVKYCLDTELKRHGIPTSEAAQDLLGRQQMQRAENERTFIETEKLRLKQEYKAAYLSTQRNGLTGTEYMRYSNIRSQVTAEIITKFGSNEGADIIVAATIEANADLARGGSG